MATTIYKFQSDLKGLQQLNAGLKEAKKNLDALKKGTKEYAAASKDVGGMTQSLNKNTNSLNKTRGAANQLNKSGRNLMTTFKGASIAIISAFAFRAIMAGMRGLVTIFAKFEAQMAAVKAISGATDKEFDKLVKSAKNLGETTVFTAAEVAQLQEELSRLGFTAPQIIAMQTAILNLAAATGESLSKAAEVAGAQINAFGLEAEQSTRITDVMGFAFANSALNLERFTQSMKFVAPVAKTAGFTIEETSAMLMTLADNGIHGSIAGNALKNIFLRLGDANSKLNQSIGYTVQGLPQLIGEMHKMNDATFGLTEATELLDKRSAPAFLTLLRNIEELEISGDQINKVEGDISRMAAVRLDTLEGDMTLLKSASEGLGLAIGETFNFELRKTVYNLTKWIKSLAKNKQAIQNIKRAIFAMLTAMKYLLIRMAALKVLTLSSTISFRGLWKGVRLLVVSFKGFTFSVRGASTALKGFRAALASTGVGLLVVGIGMLVGWLTSLSDATEEVEFEQMKLNESFHEELDVILKLNEYSQNRHDNLRELNATYKDLLGNIDLEIMKTEDLIKLKKIINDVSLEGVNVKKQEQKIADMDQAELDRLAALPADSDDEAVMLDNSYKYQGQPMQEGFAGEFVAESDLDEQYIYDPSENYETQREIEMEHLEELKEIRDKAILDEAEQQDIILATGESYRMKQRGIFLTELEDFREMNGEKQQLYIEEQRLKLENLEFAQTLLEQQTENSEAASVREEEINKFKMDSEKFNFDFMTQQYVQIATLTEEEKAAVTNHYSDLSTRSLNNSNKAVQGFHSQFMGKAGEINVVISEMRKHVSNLTKSLDKSGRSYGKSALSGFRLQKTKDRVKELRKIQISQINDTYQRELQANEDSYNNQIEKYEKEGKLIDTNQSSIQKIIDKNEKKSAKKRHKQWVADIKANKNNYDVLKNMDIEEWDKLMDIKQSNNDDYLKVLQDMLDEEVAKEVTNAQVIEELKKEKANEELKIEIENRAKIGELQREEARQLVNLNETDISNLISNQDARMKLLKDDHKEQERADQEKYDNDEMLEIEFNNRKRARAEEMKKLEADDRVERLEAFQEMYSAMADVVMAVSARIAQTNMENIEKEHKQRTDDLNNQFERELELAEQHGGDTEAMQRAHDDKMEALEKIKDDKIRQIKKRQFILDKANNVAMALINGAQAIAKVTAQTGVGAVVAAPITYGLIAAQIGTIMAQKFTGAKGGIIPGGDDKFADGGMVVGPSHANGGVKFAVGGRVAELEGGEAVINKRSTAMFHGQLSAMNAAGGGVRFETGGITPGTRAALDGAKGNWSAGDIAKLISSSINAQQVYVSESEITSTQSNVGVTESLSNLF